MNLQTIEKLGQMTILTEENQSIAIANLWKTQPVVLMFIRHFG